MAAVYEKVLAGYIVGFFCGTVIMDDHPMAFGDEIYSHLRADAF